MPNGIEILIVEDSRTQAVQLQSMLEQHGFHVSCTTNGREAFTLILTNQELRCHTETDGQTQVVYAGQQHTLTADPVQIVDLLLSTFDTALQKNRELERLTRELTRAQLELRQLHEQLEDRVEERTRALAVSEKNHRALLENNADAILVVDQNATVRFVNPAAAELLQRPVADLLDTTLDFPIRVGETREVAIPRGNGEPVVAEMRAMQTLWEGENACVATLRDITLRKNTEATLQRAKDAAEAADRAKSEFLANMSHEIRTPMNGIIGMTGLLLDTPLNAEQQEHTSTVQDCASSLLSIINEILDFSKIEAGNLDLDTYDFDLHTTIEDVSAQFAQQAEERGLLLTSLIHPDVPPLLSGDPGRLRQILVNLLENALKFTEKGEITLHVTLDITLDHATEQQAIVRFAVSDTGIGVPADRLDCLFQPFSQVDSSSTRKYGGTGLGLALCQELVTLMQGTIGVDSKLGEGSTFWFSVPLTKCPAPMLPTLSERTDLQGLVVLIVDPNQTNRTILEHQLSAWGMKTSTAQDGHQALEMLLSAAQPLEDVNAAQAINDIDAGKDDHPYHIAILDRQMPGMDGIELARAIRADSRLARIRLVLLTASGKRGDGAQARAAGINAYLTKPVQKSQLMTCLRTVMEQQTRLSSSSVLITQHTLAEAQRYNRPRVLVVEDNLVNQTLLARLVEKFGYRADVAPNGQEALTALAQRDYAVVLMDCQLPEIDGFEATSRIRERDRQRGTHTPIIAVTANDTPEDEAHCLAAGMDAYVAKPINREVLRDTIAHWIHQSTEFQQRPSADIDVPPRPANPEEPEPPPAGSLQPPTSPVPVPAPAAVPSTPAEPQPTLRVLVTEDNVVNQKLVVRLLEKMGYRADIAINGRVAVETLAQHTYDIVLMDCQMPEMDGFQATAKIREQDQQRGVHTPIIALTAHAIEGDRERCLAAGMDDYVSKPIRPEILKATLARWRPMATEPPHPPHREPQTTEPPDQLQEPEHNNPAASPASLPLAPALDLDEALARVDGDKAFLQEMAEIFLTECPHFLAQIQAALSTNDSEVLIYAAHTLKGSVGNFVATETYEAAHVVESIGRRGDLSPAPLAVARLELALSRLTPVLSNLQAELEALAA